MKNDAYYIEKILDDINYIIEKMLDKEYDDFIIDTIFQDAMMFRLIQISENAKLLSDEYKISTDVPWTTIQGLRNRIVHDYGHVDLKIVYDTLKDDIPSLKEMIAC